MYDTIVSIESKRNGNLPRELEDSMPRFVSIESKRNGNDFLKYYVDTQTLLFQSNLRGMETGNGKSI